MAARGGQVERAAENPEPGLSDPVLIVAVGVGGVEEVPEAVLRGLDELGTVRRLDVEGVALGADGVAVKLSPVLGRVFVDVALGFEFEDAAWDDRLVIWVERPAGGEEPSRAPAPLGTSTRVAKGSPRKPGRIAAQSSLANATGVRDQLHCQSAVNPGTVCQRESVPVARSRTWHGRAAHVGIGADHPTGRCVRALGR
jgi:hypothetical protein